MATKPLALPIPVSRRPLSRHALRSLRWPSAALLRRGARLLLASLMLLSLGATARVAEVPVTISGVQPAADWNPNYSARPRATLGRIAPPPAGEYPYKSLIAEMAAKYDLSPELVAGVVYIESNFDKHAISHAGAVGLMQLMPATAKPLAERLGFATLDLNDPRQNLELGCYFLRILLDKYDGHLPTALSYYNGGRWGIVSRGVYRNRRYIRKVMDSYWRYAQPVSNGFSTGRQVF